MSCGSCHCSPCSCDECDPNNEPLASALNNFIAAFFGTLTKTCVNNQVQWILPCNLDAGVFGFPRVQGEGLACYLLRLFESVNTASCLSFQDKIFINGTCYTTWQAAYDANIAASSLTAMIVGPGSSYGDLTLTAAYNPNIVIQGIAGTVSTLGNLNGGGFGVPLTSHNIIIGAITSAGAIITLTGKNSTFGAMTGSSVIIQTQNSRFNGQINILSSSSVVREGVFTTTTGNDHCIADLSANGAQFQDCLFIPNGTGNSINASVARTVIGYGILHKNGFGVNVTLSEGNEQTSPNLLAP